MRTYVQTASLLPIQQKDCHALSGNLDSALAVTNRRLASEAQLQILAEVAGLSEIQLQMLVAGRSH